MYSYASFIPLQGGFAERLHSILSSVMHVEPRDKYAYVNCVNPDQTAPFR